MTPKKCMSIAKSLTDTQHMELEPLCTGNTLDVLLPQGYGLETVQDFLIKLDIKPLMHLLKISIFSLNNDILRLTKIMNNLVKDCKIRTFKVIFQCLKLVESFRKKNSVKNI